MGSASAGHIGPESSHLHWSKNIPPVLSISSGDTVTFTAADSSNGQITPSSDASTLTTFDLSNTNPVYGPVSIKDAHPGDVLKVEVVDLRPATWGWTAILPKFGLLATDFPSPALQIWDLDTDAGVARSRDAKIPVRIPLRPFLGCMGVAPASDDPLSTIPPTPAGGNMDCRDLTIGSTVYIPIQTEGALFSCGDGHAAQGHGEVCGTAIETPMTATLRFEVCRDRPWVTAPAYEVPPSTSGVEFGGHYAAMGVDADMVEASRKAVRAIVLWLMKTRGLTGEEAYMLASVVGDLRIVESVNMPNYVVSMAFPLGVFE